MVSLNNQAFYGIGSLTVYLRIWKYIKVSVWERKMSEICKTCRNKFDSGIWISPQFKDEKVLLFCSEKCKDKYLKMKLERIKVDYHQYYDRIKQLGQKIC